ncbi:MAG: glycosyltransferase family 9 protein [candidate division Zixibacteria bacterium]|nr:glycosyltransferase family 9 protein [candidate division Zixibacteria bacterium]
MVKKTEHLFKRILFLFLRLILKNGDRSLWPISPDKVKSILILRPDKLGDMIATVPAIHALKQRFPHIKIVVMASPRNKEIIESDPQVDAIALYTKNFLFDLGVIARLRREKFDIVYDPICHDSITGLLLTKIIGRNSIKAASRKLKFHRFYDYCELYQPDGEDHNIDNGLLILNVFGIDPAGVDPFLPIFIPPESIKKAEAFFRALPSENSFWVGVNISAGSFTRTLPLEKYAAIINGIAGKYRAFKFLIFCTMDERERGISLLGSVKAAACLVPENLSLLDAVAVLGRVTAFISPDTSLVHIAGLMKIPLVGLYSGHMRNFHFWRPYRRKYGAVIAGNIDHLHDIEPEQVLREFDLVITELKQTHPEAVPLS